LLCISGLVGLWAGERRARPPQFSENQYADVFFVDPLKQLQGPRPPLRKSGSAPARASPASTPLADARPTAGSETAQEGTAREAGWKTLVSAETLEDEIKRLKLSFDQLISTPTSFRDGGYTDARKQLTGLAAWMGVIAEYDGEVRWKADAVAARDLLAKTADNCKAASEQSFNSAKQRKADLQELLSGSAKLPASTREDVGWPEITDHGVLMTYLEELYSERLKPLAGGSIKGDDQSAFIRDCELIAAIGRILQQEGMVHADEVEYAKLAATMERAGVEARDAARSEDLEKARTAVGQIGKSCTDCHGEYQ